MIELLKSADFNDMATAYGMFSLQGQGSKDQIYIGWRNKISTATYDKFADHLTAGVKLFWEQMGAGKSVEAALEWTEDHYPSTKCWESMWGFPIHDGTNFFDVEGNDNIFLWGTMGVDISDIRLEY